MAAEYEQSTYAVFGPALKIAQKDKTLQAFGSRQGAPGAQEQRENLDRKIV